MQQAAGDVCLGRNIVALLDGLDLGSDLDHFPGQLMTQNLG